MGWIPNAPILLLTEHESSQRKDQLAMMRDELLRWIAALPADSDVGVQIGDDHLDIAEVVRWGDGTFGALRCHSGDLRDMLVAWELPRELRERLAPSRASTTSVPDVG